MASITQRGDKFQLRVKHKILPKPYFATFDSHEEAAGIGLRLEAILDSGRIPVELLERAARVDDPKVSAVIRNYVNLAPVTDSDSALLGVLMGEVSMVSVSQLTFSWVDSYVTNLKQVRNLAPGTVRKRIGALARVMDWHLKREAETRGDKVVPVNPFRLMPVGYSQYSKVDAQAMGKDQEVKRDVQRDRRLHPEEEERIRAVLAGYKREGRERALAVDPALSLMFDVILDTGIRLFEAYRLTADKVDCDRGILAVDGSKGARGAVKPRVVPLKRNLRDSLRSWCHGKDGLVFPFWDGDPAERERTSNRLSNRFSSLFRYAGVEDFSEHDLRHEATCRWFTLRSADGRWMFSEIEICRIMGWTSTKMALRYASLRGEDLADRLL